MKKLKNRKGIGFVDSGVKILIAVVIGALLLGGLYTVQKEVIIKNTSEKVKDLFDYNGENNSNSSSQTYTVRRLSPEQVSQDDSITITIEIPYDEFDYCTIDDNNYSTQSGFWVCEDDGYISFIALPPVLRKLSTGTHTLKAYSKDGGFGEAIFKIK